MAELLASTFMKDSGSCKYCDSLELNCLQSLSLK